MSEVGLIVVLVFLVLFAVLAGLGWGAFWSCRRENQMWRRVYNDALPMLRGAVAGEAAQATPHRKEPGCSQLPVVDDVKVYRSATSDKVFGT
jgi:hypothetical protein